MPPLTWVVRRWPPMRLRLLGRALLAAGLVTLVAVLGWDLATWYAEAPGWFYRYLWQRVLFVLATRTEVPALQVIAAGLVCLAFARRGAGPVTRTAAAARPPHAAPATPGR